MSPETSERPIYQAYQQDSNEVLKGLGTSEQGLSSSEAQLRLARHGPNQLAEEAPVSRWKLQLRQIVAQIKAIEKWDGKLPSVNGGSVPFISVADLKK